MMAIQRSAATGVLFDKEIDKLIGRAPALTSESLAVCMRTTLDRHYRYDVAFTRTQMALVTLDAPRRREACKLLAAMSSPDATFKIYEDSTKRLARFGIDDPSVLFVSDRALLAEQNMPTVALISSTAE